MKTLTLLILISSSLFSSTLLNAQYTNKYDNRFNSTINNLKSELSLLISNAYIIDADNESIWAYNTADSILNTIELGETDNSKSKSISQIFTAYTYVFYGMSYTRMVYFEANAIKSGNSSTFALASEIIKLNRDSYLGYISAEQKLAESMLLFYKVNNAESYSRLKSVHDDASDYILEANLEYNGRDLYKISSLMLKKQEFLFLSVFVSELIISVELTEKEVYVEYNNIQNLAQLMDIPPVEYEEIIELSDEDYTIYILVSLDIISEMTSKLNTYIKKNN